MSTSSFEQFRRIVLDDPALQQQLRTESGLHAFLELVVRLGAERGYEFSAEDVHAALQASRRTWLERWI